MTNHIIKVLFSETDSAIFPAVNDGFCDVCGSEKGDTFTFEFEGDYDQWKSQSSAANISEYSISIQVGDFAYKLKPNDNDPSGDGPDKGDYDLIAKDGDYITATANQITINKFPSKWVGIEFEYDVTVSGNGKTGTLDPRGRARR